MGVDLDDVHLAARNYEEDRTRKHRAYRDALVVQCWRDGNVTRPELARAAGLSESSVRRIIEHREHVERTAAEPELPPWPVGKLRPVRDEDA